MLSGVMIFMLFSTDFSSGAWNAPASGGWGWSRDRGCLCSRATARTSSNDKLKLRGNLTCHDHSVGFQSHKTGTLRLSLRHMTTSADPARKAYGMGVSELVGSTTVMEIMACLRRGWSRI